MNRLSAATVAALVAVATLPAHAQLTSDVTFEPGKSGATLNGAITGQDYLDYRLEAKAGQSLTYELKVAETNGNGTIFVNLLPPGSNDVAIYIGSMDVDASETIALPEDGVYTLRTYLMGNDADTGKTVGYAIDLSIK